MTRAQRIVHVFAGLLIAARVFVPVTECTRTTHLLGFTNFSSYRLPRFIPWNYGPFDLGPVHITWAHLPPGSEHPSHFTKAGEGNWRYVPTGKGEPNQIAADRLIEANPAVFANVQLPVGATAVIGEGWTWQVTLPKPSPSLLERILTLDAGGYYETTCRAAYTQKTLFGVTLLQALGIATIAGVLFVVLPRHTALSAR